MLFRDLRSEAFFKREICEPLLYLAKWQTNAISTFGKVASGSAAFERLITSLHSRSGLEKVKGCLQSNTPLHGKGNNDIGIQELLLRSSTVRVNKSHSLFLSSVKLLCRRRTSSGLK